MTTTIALHQQFLIFTLSHWPSLLLTLFVLRLVYLRYLHPLSHIPGPPLASLTRFYLLAVFLRERQEQEYLALHAKYGPVVRISPNTVLFDNPTGKESKYFDWDKSDWWRAFRTDPFNVPHANELDAKLHGVKKRKVMGAYSMSRVVANEGSMDRIVSQFMEQMRKRCNEGKVFDLAPWLQYVAFDVAMEMAFSNPLGFVKEGKDVGGLIASLHQLIVGAAVAALFPGLPKVMQWKWWWKWFEPDVNAEKGPGRIRGLAYEQVRRRFGEEDRGKYAGYNDILQWIVDKETGDGEMISQIMMEQEAVGPVVAGSDSTAASMRAVVLYVASNPRVLRKLQREIDEADKNELLSESLVRWEEVKKHVPYVEVVCREGLRMFPIVGSPLFRVAPRGGVEVQGHWIPEGTEIGFSQWVVSRNKAIWGEDAEVFRPERWTEDVGVEERRLRDAGDVFFGSGIFMCTGRNVAAMELSKIMCEFFRRFDVEIVNPVQPWKQRNGLAIIHWDFWVRLTERDGQMPVR